MIEETQIYAKQRETIVIRDINISYRSTRPWWRPYNFCIENFNWHWHYIPLFLLWIQVIQELLTISWHPIIQSGRVLIPNRFIPASFLCLCHGQYSTCSPIWSVIVRFVDISGFVEHLNLSFLINTLEKLP